MSFTRETTIWCDWESDDQFCTRFFQEPTPHADEARKAARQQGWVRRDGSDYCPEHSGHERKT